MNKYRFSRVYRLRPRKHSSSYASVLGGDLRGATLHEPAASDVATDAPADKTTPETTPETAGATSGEHKDDAAAYESDEDDAVAGDHVFCETATSGAAAAAAGRGCALVGEVFLPEFYGDPSTHPVDFVVDLEAWLVSRHVGPESWVDVAIERMFGPPRMWALVRYPRWINWPVFRGAFLARYWDEKAKMALIDEFFSSKYSRKEFGSTANYAMFWMNKVKHLLMDKTNNAYSIDRYSFLIALGRQLPPDARGVLRGSRNLSNEQLLDGLRRSDRLPGRDQDVEVEDDYSLPFF